MLINLLTLLSKASSTSFKDDEAAWYRAPFTVEQTKKGAWVVLNNHRRIMARCSGEDIANTMCELLNKEAAKL